MEDAYSLFLIALFIPYISKKHFLIWLFVCVSILIINFENDNRGLFLYLIGTIAIFLIVKLRPKFYRIAELFIFIPLTIIIAISFFSFGDSNIETKDSFFNDTRTFLIVEVDNHLEKYHSRIWGTTPGVGYYTNMSELITYDDNGNRSYNIDDLLYGRQSSENQIANYYQWGGYINVLMFTFLILSVVNYSYRKNPNNKLALCLMYFIIFRTVFTYIGGLQMKVFETIDFWLAISLLLNDDFLRKTDSEIKADLKQVMDEVRLFK